jgi:hypothetical protein
LDSHSVEDSGPQDNISASAQRNEFSSLIEDTKNYEGKPMGNFDIDVAKRAFNQIDNKSDFLRPPSEPLHCLKTKPRLSII